MTSLAARLHTRWPVWSIASGELGATDLEAWQLLDAAAVRRLFARDAERRDRFLGFLEAGYIGIVLADGEDWISYGWLATPQSPQPIHLPQRARGRYWIFYCRTHEQHRNRGHYRHAMQRLIQEAERRRGAVTPVFIDTREDNRAARVAIERLGFRPAGVVHIYRLPKTAVSVSRWARREPHPVVR